jgi:prepilin-type processing-associated H-X9-DG protein
MLAEFMDIPWLLWWQIPLLFLFLAFWLLVTPLLLWVGGKYIVRAPAATFGRCFLTILLAGVASFIVGLVPFIGWLIGLFVTWLIIMWMLKTSFGKAILAWLPTIPTAFIALVFMVSAMMPMLNRARELAKRTMCMSNLVSIGKCCMIYMSDNNDAMPPSLEILVKNTYPEPKLLQCPSSFVDGVSYFYLAPMPGAPSTVVIACDYAVNHNSGEMRNVLFADGVVKPMKPDEFSETMAKPANAHFAAALAEAERNLPVRPPKG